MISGAVTTGASPTKSESADTRPRVTCPPGSVHSGNGCIDRRPVTVEACPSARKGLAFYRRAYNRHREDRGAETHWPAGRKPINCADARQLAKVWRVKAKTARVKLERWQYEYAWWLWLPDKFRRVGHCETGHTWGQNFPAGNFRWDSGKYVSAFGILRSAFPTWTGHNSPREQYEVAAAIQRRFGWGAWGCGNA